MSMTRTSITQPCLLLVQSRYQKIAPVKPVAIFVVEELFVVVVMVGGFVRLGCDRCLRSGYVATNYNFWFVTNAVGSKGLLGKECQFTFDLVVVAHH